MKGASYISTQHKISSIIMLLALIWLTVSIPFVYSAQKQLAAEEISIANNPDNKSDSGNNPFGSITEEKTPGNISISEEYLHHTNDLFHLPVGKVKHEYCHSYDVYVAYHGELLTPPPNSLFL